MEVTSVNILYWVRQKGSPELKGTNQLFTGLQLKSGKNIITILRQQINCIGRIKFFKGTADDFWRLLSWSILKLVLH